jgi:hypothetical protein
MFENKDLIRKMVKEELLNIIDEQLQYSMSKVYNEDNEMVESTFFEKIEDGHWIKILTRENNKKMKLFCEHVRTHDNFNKYGFTKSEEINSQITKEKIIGDERINGYTLNNSGIFIKD